MIIVLYLNYRGIANNPTKRALANMVRNHSLDLILISDPMTTFSSTQSLKVGTFGFDTFHSNAPHLACANLWCISKSTHYLSTTIFDSSSQHLTMLLQNPISSLSNLITGVYGANNPTLSKELWNQLIDTSLTTLPWCVLRDFNATLNHVEKLSLSHSNPSSLKDSQSTVLQLAFKKHSTQEAYLLGQNNRLGLFNVTASLDRALVNAHWLHYYRDPITHHLARISSDYSPILLDHKLSSLATTTPFKFENK